jgi:hypothetical protein
VYIDVKEETSQATQQNQGGGLLSIQRKTIVQQRISQACHVTERNTDVCNMASDLAAGFRKILALRTRVPLSKSGSQKSPKETLSLSLSLSKDGAKSNQEGSSHRTGQIKIPKNKTYKVVQALPRHTQIHTP